MARNKVLLDVLTDLDAFGFPREYAVRCLQLNKHNHVTTTPRARVCTEKKRIDEREATRVRLHEDFGNSSEHRNVPEVELYLKRVQLGIGVPSLGVFNNMFINIIRNRAQAAPGKAIVLNPEDYAAASGELLVIAMVLSWILTYFFAPEIIKDNELKRRVGYNNLCVGWDEAPAKYVAAPIFVATWLDQYQRRKRSFPCCSP
ncbi:KIN10 [Symbiodinium pilosum]|uniref:KIN10 protein n=1 Tax=Symbiodinium pilosum TaxID=2952 RepID=A0A812IVU7_SYMPI|nr:KIN10 [Symbiodinium pilosum]